MRIVFLLLISCSVVSGCLQPHGPQHTRPPCLSPSPGICSNACPLSRWCHPVILASIPLFSSFPSLFQHQVFSNESVLRIRWPKYLTFSISPSNEYSGLISFRTDWFDLLGVQGERIMWKDINIELSLLPWLMVKFIS